VIYAYLFALANLTSSDIEVGLWVILKSRR
jgi:hypothetical protein